MTTPTPTPGALSAAREIASLQYANVHDTVRFGLVDNAASIYATIIDRRTARPDVDALVKALEDIARIGETELVHVHPVHGSAPHQVARIARTALASHAKGGATG